jgi:TctA family transporter
MTMQRKKSVGAAVFFAKQRNMYEAFYLSSISPVMPGLIPGPMTESNLRRYLVLSKGEWKIFSQHPVALAFYYTFRVVTVLSNYFGGNKKA